MGRLLSLFAFLVLLLVVLAVGAVLALPLLPVDRFADRIEAAVEDATGLSVQLNGSIRLAAVPEVKFDLGDFVIEATDPALPPLARAEGAALSLNTRDLLRGDVTVTRMRLSGAEVNLQLDPEGGIAGMPDFAAGATNADASGAALPGALRLDGVVLERSRLQVADAGGETLLELSNINADAALESLASPLTLSARAVWQGTPLRFEGQVASLERFLSSQAVAVEGTLGFADATASLLGDLDLSTGEPAFLGWRISASGPDLSDVLTRIGVVLPVAPRLLPAFEARLTFDLDAGLLSAPQIVAQVGETRLSVPVQAILSPSGRVTFESLEPMSFSDPSLNRWLTGTPAGQVLGLPSDPELFGVTRLQTSFSGSLAADGVLSLRARNTAAAVGAQGLRFSSLRLTAGDGFFAGASIDGLEVSIPSLRRVLQTFDAVPAGLEPGVLGPLTLAGNARVSDVEASVSNAVVTLDDQRAQGSASIIFDPVPSIRASLIGGNLDLGPYLNLEASSAANRKQQAALDPGAPWGTEPFDFSAFKQANAQITASLEGLDLGITRFGRSSASLILEDGIMQAQVDETAVYSGAARGRVLIDTRGPVPTMNMQLQADAVQAGDILRDFLGIEFIEGATQTNVSLATQGPTPQTWMDNLVGGVRTEVAPSAIRGWDIPRLVDSLRSGTLLQSSATNIFFIGEQFSTILQRLAATGTIQNGVLRHEDFLANTEALSIRGRGDIDLARQRLDYGLTIDVQDGSLVVPLRIVGSWDQPELTIDGPALLDWLKGNPDVLSTIAGLWDLDQYLPEGASVASLQAEARAYIDAEATRILSEAQAFEQQIEQAVIDERERIAQQLSEEAARQRAIVEQQAAEAYAQLQAQQQAIEARARAEIEAAQQQALEARRQLEERLQNEANRAVEDGLNAIGLGGLLGN